MHQSIPVVAIPPRGQLPRHPWGIGYFFSKQFAGVGDKCPGGEENGRQILRPRVTPDNNSAKNSINNNEKFTFNSTPLWYMPIGLLPLVATLFNNFPGNTSR